MLIDYGYDKEKAQDIVFDAMYKYLEPTVPKMQKLASHKWFVSMLKKLMPIKFKFKCGYGWKITYPKTNKNEFTMITHKCIFKEIFTKYNMPNMTVGFCKVDNLLYDNLPNTTFSYNERIGKGGSVCDYTFKRNK